jgi:hypothetical protein
MAPEVKQALLALAGEGSLLATRHRMYLDIVARAIPFLPLVPIWHPLENLNSKLTHFQIEALDIVDTVASKLKRFNSNDQSDIKAMIERDLVDHERLLERFVSAVDRFSGDARADDLPRYVRNLNRIERDIFFVDESEIDLPGWI